MASDVQAKHEGPLWKPEKTKLTRQGIRNLDVGKRIKKKKAFRYYHPMTEADAQWLICRAEWLELNPPDIEDLYYQCALCPYTIHKDEVTLDHIITRSRNKTLKYTHSNLQPTHWSCNAARGSMTMEAWNKKRGLSV